MALTRSKVRISSLFSIIDVVLLVSGTLLFYFLMGIAKEWTGPYRPKTEIDLDFLSLLWYSLFSLVRVTIAYFLSLALTFVYGYMAAKSRIGEMILIPLLDILQSVPVTAFAPGLVLSLAYLFPSSNIGLELAAVVLIFTGQGWNMIFSFYSSLKAVPPDWRELTRLLGLRKMEVLKSVEIPFAMHGLLWNSMVSMAGGWFFLMTIEQFSLGENEFRLPGIGAYMSVAYDQGNSSAILAGIATMFLLIIIVDRCVWHPLVVWSERFKLDQNPNAAAPHSLVLDWLKRSRLLPEYFDMVKRIRQTRNQSMEKASRALNKIKHLRLLLVVARIVVSLFVIFFAYRGLRSLISLVSATTPMAWLIYLRDTGITLVRVMASTLIGSLWAIPAGVFIGTNPKWTSRLQPLVQVVASFPAPMIYPIIIGLMLKIGIGLQVGSVVLMLFASQWYILFNVISGATMIPKQMFELASLFHVTGRNYWKSIILPAIFPSLVNGWITSAGGAWNASILAEYYVTSKHNLIATGIGASIQRAAMAGDYPGLAAAVTIMVVTVVVLNRVFWGVLYKLAETRFRLEY